MLACPRCSELPSVWLSSKFFIIAMVCSTNWVLVSVNKTYTKNKTLGIDLGINAQQTDHREIKLPDRSGGKSLIWGVGVIPESSVLGGVSERRRKKANELQVNYWAATMGHWSSVPLGTVWVVPPKMRELKPWSTNTCPPSVRVSPGY